MKFAKESILSRILLYLFPYSTLFEWPQKTYVLKGLTVLVVLGRTGAPKMDVSLELDSYINNEFAPIENTSLVSTFDIMACRIT